MPDATTTAIGVFKDSVTAERVARELETSGFPAANIQVSHETAGNSYTEGERRSEGGGIAGFFRRLFGADEDETGYYEGAVRSGNAVVTVDSDERQINQAVDVMNRNGAVDVEREPAGFTAPAVGGDAKKVIPSIEEELQVGKRAVQRGAVRVYSRVIDRPVEEQVRLREEHVRVERQPVDRPVSAADTARLRDQTIEVTETAEEPVVSKRARVVEEVSIGKDATERTETVRDNVRRTEVKVERVGPGQDAGTRADYEADFRRDFEKRYAATGVSYESFAPAYQYGYSAASDPRFKDRSWGEVETGLQGDYVRNHPGSTWENLKGAVRYGWETVTGRRSAAG
jgi:uncharacterized protein (TIGR02271 family)